MALGRPSIITTVNTAAAALSLILNALLIPRLGIMGAAYAALAASLFSMTAQSVFVKIHGLALPWAAWAKPHLLLLAALALVWLGGGTLLARGIGLMLFLALALATRLVSIQDLRDILAHLTGTKGKSP